MKKTPNKKQKTKTDALAVKDLPVSGSKSTTVKGGMAPKRPMSQPKGGGGGGGTCNTNTLTCKETSVGCE